MTSITPDSSNIVFNIAVDLVNQSSQPIFLTGKAGTGKTTFLKYIRQTCPKQLAIVAPTGVAAINAGGVTIHSFFQLPFSPFIPEAKGFDTHKEESVNRHNLLSRLRMNKDRLKVLQQLELLIIDEISMVRCDTMDAIDTILRYVRKRPFERFGGVQILCIGDMFQLPPVIKEQEWKLLAPHYSSPYFFDSHVIQQELPLYVEFTKIYRQSESSFIQLLNQVRNNQLDEDGRHILESCFKPTFRRTKNEGYIILTTHNEKARTTNNRELQELKSKTFSYTAEIEGDFPDNAFPADELLQLKEGAQVMFIKNDVEKGKRYFNGKIGTVTELTDDTIKVRCKEEEDEIEVSKEKWENIRYTLNPNTRSMEEEVLGSFTQYPLRLAWAITIHKSQGLTFEKAIIDAGEAFAPGQVYVALSRCTSLDGLILQSRINNTSLATDPRISDFAQSSASSEKLKQTLALAKRQYQEMILASTFDMAICLQQSKELKVYVEKHEKLFNDLAISWTEELLQKLSSLQETALKFQIWLKQQFMLSIPPEENSTLKDRIVKGVQHFIIEIEWTIRYLQTTTVSTDNKMQAKEFNDALKELFTQLAQKRFLLQLLDGPIDPEVWHKKKGAFIVPSFSVNTYAGVTNTTVDTPHPQLYQQLKKVRDQICAKRDTPIYMVAASKTLIEMTIYLPHNEEELAIISGFGKTKAEKYGKEFLSVIRNYCEEQGLVSQITQKETKPKTKDPVNKRTDTKEESFRLFKVGMTIEAIAEHRSLTLQTIQGHLAYYIEQGEIDINQLVSSAKLLLIEPLLANNNGQTITALKQQLQADISYGDIRLVMAWKAYCTINDADL